MKKKGNLSPFPKKAASIYDTSPGESKCMNEQKQFENHNIKMRQILNEIKIRIYQQNRTKNSQNSYLDFISNLCTQDLKDLHIFIHQNENSLFSSGQYAKARHLILIGEFVDDELEKRGEIKNSKLSSPSSSNVQSTMPSIYNSPTPSAPTELSFYSPTRPKAGLLSKKTINKIQKFDDETTEIVSQMQMRHEQLRNEYVSIWEKNMQSHYFKPSKTLQDVRKHVIFLRKKCIQREELLKKKNKILPTEKQNEQRTSAESDNDEDIDDPKFEDFGDEKLKKLIFEFKKFHHICEQLEEEESDTAQKIYEKDYIESQRRIEEKQMMELELILKDRLLKRQKLLMKEGINVNSIYNSPGSKSQCTTRKGSPLNSRKNSPSKIKNISKMPPLVSYSKKTSRNATSPETPRNSNDSSKLTKEAILQLTPNIMVNIPSSPALIAIEEKITHNQEKLNKSIKKSEINQRNNMSPIFRKERKTQTSSIDNENNDYYVDDSINIEVENQPIPFDDESAINTVNNESKHHSCLPPI